MRQHPNSSETRRAIESAMKQFEALVLDPLRYDNDTGVYVYDERISIKAILELAGVRSRSTLRAEHHDALSKEVAKLVRHLKEKTGKSRRSSDGESGKDGNSIRRVEALAQTIAALNYRIMKLEKGAQAAKAGDLLFSGAAHARRMRYPSYRR